MYRGPRDYRVHRPRDETNTSIKFRKRGAHPKIYWSPDAHSSFIFNHVESLLDKFDTVKPSQPGCAICIIQDITKPSSSRKLARSARPSHLILGFGQKCYLRTSSAMKRTGNGGASMGSTRVMMVSRRRYPIIGYAVTFVRYGVPLAAATC
jgi:hypothetical protein